MTTENDPNAIQPGGTHYRSEFQHWDFMVALGFGWEYFIAAATKYLTRVKDPATDYAKALHYVDKLIHLVETGKVDGQFKTTRGLRLNLDPGPAKYSEMVDVEALYELFANANRLDGTVGVAIYKLLTSQYLADLVDARAAIQTIVARVDVHHGFTGAGSDTVARAAGSVSKAFKPREGGTAAKTAPKVATQRRAETAPPSSAALIDPMSTANTPGLGGASQAYVDQARDTSSFTSGGGGDFGGGGASSSYAESPSPAPAPAESPSPAPSPSSSDY